MTRAKTLNPPAGPRRQQKAQSQLSWPTLRGANCDNAASVPPDILLVNAERSASRH
jgi:hypothetical protein